MKRFVSVLLVLCLVFSFGALAGCGTTTSASQGSNAAEHAGQGNGNGTGQGNGQGQGQGNGQGAGKNQSASSGQSGSQGVTENGTYCTKDEVALYLHNYGHLPSNYITKKQAQKLGWEGGSLEKYSPGSCIGGDRFGNYEGVLPSGKGITYYECDIDTQGAKSRGQKRIVYDNQGNIYYTCDHYKTFTQLY